MMAEAFRCSYANFVVRKTRSVVVIELELPIEQGDAFLAQFGLPQPGKESWVAIARLTDDAPSPPKEHPGNEAERALKRAGILPSDVAFRRFLAGEDCNADVEPMSPAEATVILRDVLGVESRTSMLTNPAVLRRFLELEEQFLIAAGRLNKGR